MRPWGLQWGGGWQRLGLERACTHAVIGVIHVFVHVSRHVLLPRVGHELCPPAVVGNVRQTDAAVSFARLNLVSVGIIEIRLAGRV